MEIVNPGNVLPFYKNTIISRNKLAKHRHKPSAGEFNWAIPVNMGESLSFQVPTTPAWFGYTTFYLLDENEDILDTISSGYLPFSQDADDNAWFTYVGNSPELNSLDCGLYSIMLENSETGEFLYSEDFRVMNLSGKKNAYSLEFYHESEVDGILYQLALQQKIWLLDAVFDTPEIVQPTESLTDGNAVEVLTFQSVQRREVLKFPYFPDFWQGTLHRIRMLSNVTITSMQSGNIYEIAGLGIDLTSEDQDIVFKKGVLSWISTTQTMNVCGDDRSLTVINQIPV